MKVALVTTSLPFGGTTIFALSLSFGLRRLGIEAEVFSLQHIHPMAAEFERLGVRVHLPSRRNLIFEDGMAETLERLRAFSPKVVVANLGPPAFEVLRYLPDGVLRVGMLQDHHPAVYKLLETYRPWVDQFAAVSGAIQAEVAAHHPGIPCSVMFHGIIFEPDTRRAANPAQPLKILYFGRLEQTQKQVRMLPEIIRGLQARGIPFCWTILGQGAEETFLRESLATEISSGEVTMASPILNLRDLAPAIAAHDVFLLCSRHEGGPLTLLESMGYGLVPVCGDIPSLAQRFLVEENGLLVPQPEPSAYAEAIGKLHRDRTLLESLSAQSFDAVKKDFTAEAMAQRYLRLFETHLPAREPAWPDTFSPQSPLGVEEAWRMNPALRPLRRLLKRLKFD